jgi:hypothetical protein
MDTAAKLLGMNPIHDLRKNGLSDVHSESLALALLRKIAKWSSNRSQATFDATILFSAVFKGPRFAQPDDSEVL